MRISCGGFFMFAVFVFMIFGVGIYMGHGLGYADGAKDERVANKNKLESCQRMAVANMFKAENDH